MNYQEACATMGVEDTKRQRAKWKAKRGRAYVLAQHFEIEHKRRQRENAKVQAKLDSLEPQIGDQVMVIAAQLDTIKALKESDAPSPERMLAGLEGDLKVMQAELDQLKARREELEALLWNVPATVTETQHYLDTRSRELNA
jgi:capsule polysaccharide export protein KpsE/RkpR